MSEWKPIETAPEGRIFTAGWCQPEGGVDGYWWWEEDQVHDGQAFNNPDATHWCPIVLPPFPDRPEK